jgi:two-component system, LuxR family, sensor histidine kinase DctS
MLPANAPPLMPIPPRWRRLRRALLWAALVMLLLVAQSLLVALTINYESNRLQEAADSAAGEASAEVRQAMLRALRAVQGLAEPLGLASDWQRDATAVLQQQPALVRLERRDADRRITDVAALAAAPALFAQMPRGDLDVETELACTLARRSSTASFSRSYYVPMRGGSGIEVIDLCLPLGVEQRDSSYLVATFALHRFLESALPSAQHARWELSFVEADGARLARAGPSRGAATYVAERLIDLPGHTLLLRADSTGGRPSLIPNLTTALVMGLSVALFALVLLLARDVRRRGQAERALAEALAFRQAMEDSLITGLRARDLQGQVTYANPAFCAMVGFDIDELRRSAPPHWPPYWPPERAPEYASRLPTRLDLTAALRRESREGFETEFMRKSGERFPVMIYEAPLVDGEGRHTGWMSAVVDLSAQRRIEELSRQQQDRLQASARLATVGEMASLLSHELNQPLAAIASYASGSLNLLAAQTGQEPPDVDTGAMLKQALTRIEEQAARAGLVIKSVHDFVRRREQHHERVAADVLIEAVMPLVRLQARKSGTRVELDVPQPAPVVMCDRTMLEQVLLNLTRNGIQAMEQHTPLAQRVLTLRVQLDGSRRVAFSVSDAGPGIAADIAPKLFTPFFTTRREGMGLGLSLCRTVIEQHGGALEFAKPAGQPEGAEFRFTLAAAAAATPTHDRAIAPNP